MAQIFIYTSDEQLAQHLTHLAALSANTSQWLNPQLYEDLWQMLPHTVAPGLGEEELPILVVDSLTRARLINTLLPGELSRYRIISADWSPPADYLLPGEEQALLSLLSAQNEARVPQVLLASDRGGSGLTTLALTLAEVLAAKLAADAAKNYEDLGDLGDLGEPGALEAYRDEEFGDYGEPGEFGGYSEYSEYGELRDLGRLAGKSGTASSRLARKQRGRLRARGRSRPARAARARGKNAVLVVTPTPNIAQLLGTQARPNSAAGGKDAPRKRGSSPQKTRDDDYINAGSGRFGLEGELERRLTVTRNGYDVLSGAPDINLALLERDYAYVVRDRAETVADAGGTRIWLTRRDFQGSCAAGSATGDIFSKPIIVSLTPARTRAVSSAAFRTLFPGQSYFELPWVRSLPKSRAYTGFERLPQVGRYRRQVKKIAELLLRREDA